MVVLVANVGTMSNDIQNGIYKYGIGVRGEIMGPGGGYESRGNSRAVWRLESRVIRARGRVRAGGRCEEGRKGGEERGVVRRGGSGAWWARAECAHARRPGALLVLRERMALPAGRARVRATPGARGCQALACVVLQAEAGSAGLPGLGASLGGGDRAQPFDTAEEAVRLDVDISIAPVAVVPGLHLSSACCEEIDVVCTDSRPAIFCSKLVEGTYVCHEVPVNES